MTTTAGRPTTDDIRKVAIELFTRAGFDGVTVEDVAAAAGVSPSTIYRHFGTKGALVLPAGAPEELVAAYSRATAKRPKDSPTRAFRRAAVRVFDDTSRDQLAMIAGDPTLAVAFEHDLFGGRHALAAAIADHRGRSAPGSGDAAASAALLGALIAVLERWASRGSQKSLNKTLAKLLPEV